MKQRTLFSGFCLLILITLVSPRGLAQEESQQYEDERYKDWYQIELIVFERLAENNSASAEFWPKTLKLEYPDELDFLFTQTGSLAFLTEKQLAEQAAEAAEKERLLEETESATGAPLIEEANADENGLVQQAEDPLGEPVMLTDSYDAESISEQRLLEGLNEAQPQLPEMAQPRVLLENEERTLRAESSTLSRRSAYRVIFHEAWRQPLLNSESSRAIPIAGGDSFENHHELEGWIKISLNRFLHLETYLWRADYELNYGQKIEYWPEIPSFPAPSNETNDEESANLSATGIGFDAYLSQDNPIFSLSTNTYDTQIPLQSYDEIEKSPYVVKQIVTLSQKRRMRSEELHYIDHPRLGILIKLTPHTVYFPDAIEYQMHSSPLDNATEKGF